MKPNIDDIRKVLRQAFTLSKYSNAYYLPKNDLDELAGELDNLLCDAYFQGQLSVRREIAERGKA